MSGVRTREALSPAEIQGEREIRVELGLGRAHGARRMADAKEAGEPATFCFVGVYWESFIVTASGMGDMIAATADGLIVPRIHDVEHER